MGTKDLTAKQAERLSAVMQYEFPGSTFLGNHPETKTYNGLIAYSIEIQDFNQKISDSLNEVSKKTKTVWVLVSYDSITSEAIIWFYASNETLPKNLRSSITAEMYYTKM